MAVKPDVSLSRFATGPGEDVEAIPSGLADTGFVEGTPANQSYVNELFNQHYQWALYLDDGELDGDHVIDGALEVTGAFEMSGQVKLTGAINAPIASTVQNFAPTGHATANAFRVSSASAADGIGGITGGVDGRILIVTNVGPNDFDLVHDDSGSDADKRFALPNGDDITLRPNGGATLRYDGTDSLWRVIGLAA